MPLVVDASALYGAAVEEPRRALVVRRRIAAEDCHAPHLIDAELGSALRRRVLRGELAVSDAEAALADSASLINERHEMTGSLAADAWSLRDTLSFYDALYVALAAALCAPLLTADARLAAAPGLPCAVDVLT
jgi:predicted nucleic acid-binding protein